MQTLEIIKQMKGIVIIEISETNLKNWFSKYNLNGVTGAEIKKCAKEAGINLIPCKTCIPIDFKPIENKKIEFVRGFHSKLEVFSKDEIIELYYKKDMLAEEIIKIKGCALNTFYNYLRLYGLKTKKQIFSEKLKNINELYNNGLSIEKIAMKFGVSYSCVQSRILNPRPRPQKRSKATIRKSILGIEQMQEINKIYNTGFTIKELAKMYYVGFATIQRCICNPRRRGRVEI